MNFEEFLLWFLHSASNVDRFRKRHDGLVGKSHRQRRSRAVQVRREYVTSFRSWRNSEAERELSVKR